MLSSLFAVFALTTSPVDPTAHPIEVEIEVSSTGFSARSYTDSPQLLLFSNSGGTVECVLPAGATLAWSFPQHALDGVEVEVLSAPTGPEPHTEPLVLSEVVALGIERVWIQAGDAQAIFWAETAGGLAELTPSNSGSMPSLGTPLPLQVVIDSEIGPTHVPVITPSDTPQGDLPPDVGDGPLPPV